MVSFFDGFKQLAEGVPLEPPKANFNPSKVYAKFMAREPWYDIDSFLGLKIEGLITKIAKTPKEYNDLFSEYKTVARKLQEKFNKQ